MSESTYAKKALPEWQKEHPEARTFRNNSGMAWQGEIGLKFTQTSAHIGKHERILENPRPIFFGVGLPVKDKKTGRIKQKGGGDRIGWETTDLCILAHETNTSFDDTLCKIYHQCKFCPLSKKIAVFLNLEIKTKNVPESEEQKQFREMVIAAGGISIILREK